MTNELAKLIVTLKADIRDFIKKIQKVKQEVGKFDKRLEQSKANIKKWSAAFAIAATAIIASLGKVIQSAMKFEKQMSFVGSMLDEQTRKVLPEYARKIREISKAYGQSTESISQATYDYLSALGDTTQAMEFVEQATIAATGGFTDVGTAMKGGISVYLAYKDKVQDIGEVFDWLHATVKAGRTTFEQVAEVIGSVASIASSAGVTLDDLGLSFSLLTLGLSPERAATAFRAIINSLAKVNKESEEVQAAQKELGVTWDLNLVNGGRLVESLGKLSDATFEMLTGVDANVRSTTGWAIMINNAALAQEKAKIFTDKLGLSQKQANKVTEDSWYKWNQLKQEFQDVLRVTGESLLPKFKEVVEVVKTVVGQVTDFSEKNKSLIATLGTIAGAVAGLLLVLAGLGIGALGILALSSAFGGLLFPIAAVVTAIGGLWLLLDKDRAILFVSAFKLALNDLSKAWTEWIMKAQQGLISLLNFQMKISFLDPIAQATIQKSLDAMYQQLAENKAKINQYDRENIELLKEQAEIIENINQDTLKSPYETVKKFHEDTAKFLEQINQKVKYDNDELLKNLKYANDELLKNLKYANDESIAHVNNNFENMGDKYSETAQSITTDTQTMTASIRDEVNSMAADVSSTFSALGENVSKIASIVNEGMKKYYLNGGAVVYEYPQSTTTYTSGETDTSWYSYLDSNWSWPSDWDTGFASDYEAGQTYSFQHGNYQGVGETGYYKLHQGEKVIPKDDGGSASGVTIVNVLSQEFIRSIMANNPDVIVNIISEDVLNNGVTRKVIKEMT